MFPRAGRPCYNKVLAPLSLKLRPLGWFVSSNTCLLGIKSEIDKMYLNVGVEVAGWEVVDEDIQFHDGGTLYDGCIIDK